MMNHPLFTLGTLQGEKADALPPDTGWRVAASVIWCRDVQRCQRMLQIWSKGALFSGCHRCLTGIGMGVHLFLVRVMSPCPWLEPQVVLLADTSLVSYSVVVSFLGRRLQSSQLHM